MIVRTFDSARLNEIINDVSVFELIAEKNTPSPLDMTSVVKNINNFCLIDGETPALGGFVFLQTPVPGVYSVHTQFLPEGRGQYAMLLARESLQYMFCKTDCIEVLTQVPRFNAPALALAKAVGFTQEFTRKNAFEKRNSESKHDLDFLSLRFSNWALNDNNNLDRGQKFHAMLHEMENAPEHSADDAVHDKIAGACLEILFNGLVDKALHLYNKWTLFAGYSVALKLSHYPLLVRFESVVMEFDIAKQSFSLVKGL